MMKINSNNWKKFQIKDIFETRSKGNKLFVPTGAYIPKKALKQGSTPRITVSGSINGVSGYFEDINSDDYRLFENFISVSFLGTVFYQSGRASLDMKVHCLKPIEIKLNDMNATFLVTIIRQTLGQIEYSDQVSSSVLPFVEIMLPCTKQGEPDWNFMDEYMSKVMKESKESLRNLRIANNDRRLVNTSKWESFSMKELGFSNFHGKRLNKADRIEGKTPFVTAGFDNRGIAQRIGNNLPIYQKAITVDMFGNCFFQADDCTGDDNVYFFINDDISEFCKLFISTCIHTVTSKLFAYVEQFRQSDANTLSVKLPVDVKGNPDWDYMENYMKKTMTECKHSLSASEMAI